MKKVIKLFVVIAMTISASLATANDSFKVNVVGEKKFKVEVTEIQGAATSYVKDAQGQILYRGKSEEGKIKLIFDFSILEAGEYELVVKDEYKVQSLPITVTTEGIEIDRTELQKTFFPRMEQKEDEVIVKLLSDEKNDLFVSITDNNGTVLVEDKVDGKDGLIGKRYKFNPGEYTITMVSDDFATTSRLSVRK